MNSLADSNIAPTEPDTVAVQADSGTVTSLTEEACRALLFEQFGERSLDSANPRSTYNGGTFADFVCNTPNNTFRDVIVLHKGRVTGCDNRGTIIALFGADVYVSPSSQKVQLERMTAVGIVARLGLTSKPSSSTPSAA